MNFLGLIDKTVSKLREAANDICLSTERKEIIAHLAGAEMEAAIKKCRVFIHKYWDKYIPLQIGDLKLQGVNDISGHMAAMDDLLSEGFAGSENIFQDKIAFLDKYVETYGDYRVPHVLLAWEYLKHNDYEKAIHWALKACSIDERCMPSWHIMRIAFLALQEAGRLGECLSPEEINRLQPLGYDLKGVVCPLAFERIFVQSTGEVMCCCPPLLPVALGNVFIDRSWRDIINSPAAIEIRDSILNGSYKYCNRLTCQWLKDKSNDRQLKDKKKDFFKFNISDFKGNFLASPLNGKGLPDGWEQGRLDAVRARSKKVPQEQQEFEKWLNEIRVEWTSALNEILKVRLRAEDYRSIQENLALWDNLDKEVQVLLKKALQEPLCVMTEEELIQLNRRILETVHPHQLQRRYTYSTSIISTIGVLNLGFDQTCNLRCPQCRTDFILPSEEKKKQLDHLAEYIIPDMILSAQKMVVANTGDPFASPYYRKILKSLVPSTRNNLKEIVIFTNGLMLNPKTWEDFSNIHCFEISIAVSIDAATKETYEKVRPPGKWETLVENLKFISNLKKEKKIWYLELEYVIQTCNFREMKDFTLWAINELSASKIRFHRLINVGTYTLEDYRARAVFESFHPDHKEFLSILKDPIFFDPRVIFADLAHCLTPLIQSYEPCEIGQPGISASSTWNEHTPERAVNPPSQAYYWHATRGLPQWWQIQYTQKKLISTLGLRPAFCNKSMIKNFSLAGSNDGIHWETLCSGEHANSPLMEFYDIQTPRAFLVYRVIISSVWRDDQYAGIAEIILKEISIS